MITQAVALLVAGLTLTASDARGSDDPQVAIHQNERQRTLVVEYGPMDVPAGIGYEGELVTISAELELPIDGWVRSFDIELVADGQTLPQGLLHHAGLFAPDRRDLFSPVMERVVAFGQETEAIELPGRLGYRIEPDEPLILLGAIYNTGDTAFESVQLRLTMVYAEARRDARHDDVLPIYLDVMPPGNRVYEIPPGRSSRSLEWSPAVDGRVLALGGHLHQYGEALILEDVTAGDTLWVGQAFHGDDRELLGVSREIFHRGQPMHRDHVYRITAVYDNPTGEPIRGAMGKIGGLFMPERGQSLPLIDHSHPEYIEDWHAMVDHEHEMDHVRAAEQSAPLERDGG